MAADPFSTAGGGSPPAGCGRGGGLVRAASAPWHGHPCALAPPDVSSRVPAWANARPPTPSARRVGHGVIALESFFDTPCTIHFIRVFLLTRPDPMRVFEPSWRLGEGRRYSLPRLSLACFVTCLPSAANRRLRGVPEIFPRTQTTADGLPQEAADRELSGPLPGTLPAGCVGGRRFRSEIQPPISSPRYERHHPPRTYSPLLHRPGYVHAPDEPGD